MLQLIIRGKILEFQKSAARTGQKSTSVVDLQVRMYRQGEAQLQTFAVTLDAYWTERFEKLDEKTKYVTFRCTDVIGTVEPQTKGGSQVIMWLKAEEFFL